MRFTIVEQQLPVYFRPSYTEEYHPLHRSVARLSSNPITALHYHDHMELGICLSGGGVTYIADRRYDYKAGDLQVVPATTPHLSMAEAEETRWVWISFSPLRLLQEGGFSRKDSIPFLLEQCCAGVFHPQEHPWLTELIDRICLLPDPLGEEGGMELVFLTGLLLVECARIGAAESPTPKESAASRKLRPALDHIREHYADREEMTEGRIASLCGLSISHLRALFRKETGAGVKQYVIRTRLAAASHLLRQTDMSIVQIAFESGFGQVSSFNRIFRKVFGQTPSHFRRAAREENF